MVLHQASGRWRLGLLLALVTASCWATLPVALKITLERLDPIMLPQVSSRVCRTRGEAAHPAGRLDRPVWRMEDGTVVPAGKRFRQFVAPFDVEPVLTQSVVLGLEELPLDAVGGKPEAPGPAKGIAGQLGHSLDVALG